MIYLNMDDLKADSFERYITESTGDFAQAIDKAEATAISIAATYLSGRYNIASIFSESEPILDGLLTEILVKITLYKIFGRNAARKLPTDIKEDYEWAIATLEKINAGKLTIDLPAAIDSSTGTTKSTAIWGNNTNTNFYI